MVPNLVAVELPAIVHQFVEIIGTLVRLVQASPLAHLALDLLRLDLIIRHAAIAVSSETCK